MGGALAHHPGFPPIHRFHPGAGYVIESFSTPGDFIVDIGESGKGEIFIELIVLFDQNWVPLQHTGFAWRGGQQVEVVASMPGLVDVKEGANEPTSDVAKNSFNIFFQCSTRCGPTHSYKMLVVVGGDDVTSFGYSVRASSLTRHWNVSGDASDVHALSSRSFGGQTAHVAAHNAQGAPIGGVSFANTGAQLAEVDDMLVGMFWKPNGSSGTMAFHRPDGISHNCASAAGCTIRGMAPGEYRFEHSQTDLNGAEAYLLWADIPKL